MAMTPVLSSDFFAYAVQVSGGGAATAVLRCSCAET
eukprot:CAMPEP_0179066220 /NCGR_PEP_ID=MMETSP0796-20121207/28865_1 /TAXON_ID=73915 /ORGANISM="Pyrodinium bahamense, Strain pbaha01" /LENGTH=35 /DNA_ID= /DNA_START= /DNA_END= /DNA_ORIENTATION=